MAPQQEQQPQQQQQQPQQQQQQQQQQQPGGALSEGEVRVPLRQIVTGTLVRTVHGKKPFTCIDVCNVGGMVATCSDKVAHVWEADTWKLLKQLGQLRGSIHKAPIRCCTFNSDGTYLATCGDDCKVVIWNVAEGRTEKVLLGHRDVIFRCNFSQDDAMLFTCAADGMLVAWDWRSGRAAQQPLRHASAVRDFHVSPAIDRIACGCNDGNVCVWDNSLNRLLDTVEPDDMWDPSSHRGAATLAAWMEPDLKHTGSVCCVAFSPCGRLLLTASNDCTAKLWDIVSYMRLFEDVEKAQKGEEELQQYHDAGRVDVHDVRGDDVDDVDGSGGGQMHANEARAVPLARGYHADLLFTFRHEAPALAVQFTSDSRVVVTGSQDCTCKLWSTSNGFLLFQINTPAPISAMEYRDTTAELLCCCRERVLVFHVKRHPDRGSLPTYWQKQQDEQLFSYDAQRGMRSDAQIAGEVERRREEKAAAMRREDVTQVVDSSRHMNATAAVPTHRQGGSQPTKQGGGTGMASFTQSVGVASDAARSVAPVGLSRADILKAMSHGTIGPGFFMALASQFAPDHLNLHPLVDNMNSQGLLARMALRLLARCSYHPLHVLQRMAEPRGSAGAQFCKDMARGVSVDVLMELSSDAPAPLDDADAAVVWVDPSVFVGRPPAEAMRRRLPRQSELGGIRQVLPAQPGAKKVYYRVKMNAAAAQAKAKQAAAAKSGGRPIQAPKGGKVIRFKPTEQLRLISDVLTNAQTLRQPHMRQVADPHYTTTSGGRPMPHFNMANHAATAPPPAPKPQYDPRQKAFKKQGVRFNARESKQAVRRQPSIAKAVRDIHRHNREQLAQQVTHYDQEYEELAQQRRGQALPPTAPRGSGGAPPGSPERAMLQRIQQGERLEREIRDRNDFVHQEHLQQQQQQQQQQLQQQRRQEEEEAGPELSGTAESPLAEDRWVEALGEASSMGGDGDTADAEKQRGAEEPSTAAATESEGNGAASTGGGGEDAVEREQGGGASEDGGPTDSEAAAAAAEKETEEEAAATAAQLKVEAEQARNDAIRRQEAEAAAAGEENANLPVRGITVEFPESVFEADEAGYALTEKNVSVAPIVISDATQESMQAHVIDAVPEAVPEEHAAEVADPEEEER